jgi:hypothetical protein
VREAKRKILVAALLVGVMLLPVGATFASNPVDMTAVMDLNAEIVNSRIAGNNVISDRVLEGSFSSGPFEGDIYREIRVVIHANGKATVQNIIYVENAVVTVDGMVAEGAFIMKLMGMAGNAKWTIISSDLTSDGESVEMHGQGTAIITGFVIIDPTHYWIQNTLMGQVSLTP